MNTAGMLLADPPADATNTPVTADINLNQSLRDCVEQSMENYFKHLDGQPICDVYDMVLAKVEVPMLEVVMKYTHYNQTKASQMLGLNRGTLRTKLKQYGLL